MKRSWVVLYVASICTLLVGMPGSLQAVNTVGRLWTVVNQMEQSSRGAQNVINQMSAALANISQKSASIQTVATQVNDATTDMLHDMCDKVNDVSVNAASQFDVALRQLVEATDVSTTTKNVIINTAQEVARDLKDAIHTLDQTTSVVQEAATAVSKDISQKFDALLHEVEGLATTAAHRLDDAILPTVYAHEFIDLSNTVSHLSQAVESNLGTVETKLNTFIKKTDNIITDIEHLDVDICDKLCNLGNVNNAVATLLDVINTTIEECAQDQDDSLEKVFSKLDVLETTTIFGFNALYAKLASMNPLEAPFLISQQEIGDGGVFIIRLPGYYTLTEAISFNTGSAIYIFADNVTLDLNGKSIDGTGSIDGACITVFGSSSITIQNGSLFEAEGIVVDDAANIVIKDIVASQHQDAAINLSNVQQASIQDCVISDVNGSGVIVDASSSNIVIKNTSVASCSRYGYQLAGSNIAVQQSIAQGNGLAGIWCGILTKGQLLSNTIESNGTDGIFIAGTASKMQSISNRISGNLGTGLNDFGATDSIHLNNLSAGNGVADYSAAVKSVAISKATSYWFNVHG